MELTVFKRLNEKKSEIKKIRAQGDIPGVLYQYAGGPNQPIFIKADEFALVLRTLKPGQLSTTVFVLTTEDKKKVKAIIKDIQYELTTYRVNHVDFQILRDDVEVKLFVPIQCVGEDDCAGVKLGGILRQVIRRIQVKCLPKHIPEKFQIDVAQLGIMESRKLSDLSISEQVIPLAPMNEVLVVVAKR